MPPARPRHFPSLSGGAERFAGSRGCSITSCPACASPHHPGVFRFRKGSEAQSWAPSEPAPTSTQPSPASGNGGGLSPGPLTPKSPPFPKRRLLSPSSALTRRSHASHHGEGHRNMGKDTGTQRREDLPPAHPTRKNSACPRRDKRTSKEKEVTDASGTEAPPSPRGHRGNGCRNQRRFIVKTQPPNTRRLPSGLAGPMAAAPGPGCEKRG